MTDADVLMETGEDNRTAVTIGFIDESGKHHILAAAHSGRVELHRGVGCR